MEYTSLFILHIRGCLSYSLPFQDFLFVIILFPSLFVACHLRCVSVLTKRWCICNIYLLTVNALKKVFKSVVAVVVVVVVVVLKQISSEQSSPSAVVGWLPGHSASAYILTTLVISLETDIERDLRTAARFFSAKSALCSASSTNC